MPQLQDLFLCNHLTCPRLLARVMLKAAAERGMAAFFRPHVVDHANQNRNFFVVLSHQIRQNSAIDAQTVQEIVPGLSCMSRAWMFSSRTWRSPPTPHLRRHYSSICSQSSMPRRGRELWRKTLKLGRCVGREKARANHRGSLKALCHRDICYQAWFFSFSTASFSFRSSAHS